MYFLLLALLYYAICYVGEPFASLFFDAKVQENQSLIPLYVSLGLIGIGSLSARWPAVESRIRRIAYSAAGIPQNFYNLADDILQAELVYEDYSSNLSKDEKKLHDRVSVLSDFPGFDETQRKDLLQCLARILVFDSWKSLGRGWPGNYLRREYEPVARLISPDVSARLDEFKSVAHMPSDELAQLQLEPLLARARTTADDICCLFALFIERAAPPPKTKNTVYQLIANFITATENKRRIREQTLDAYVGSFVVGATIVILWGYLGSATDFYVVPETSSDYVSAMRYLVGLVALVFPPSAIALFVVKKRWRPSFAEGLLFPFTQYIVLFFIALVIYVLIQYTLTFTTWYYGASLSLQSGQTKNAACAVSIDWSCFVSDFSKKTLWIQPFYFAGIGGLFAVTLALLHDSARTQRKWEVAIVVTGGATCGMISFLGNEIARQLDPNSKAMMTVKWFGLREPTVVSTLWASAFQGLGVLLMSVVVFAFYLWAVKRIK